MVHVQFTLPCDHTDILKKKDQINFKYDYLKNSNNNNNNCILYHKLDFFDSFVGINSLVQAISQSKYFHSLFNKLLRVTDHIIAIADGGKHHPDNLQYLPCLENRKKNKYQNYDTSLVVKWQDVI